MKKNKLFPALAGLLLVAGMGLSGCSVGGGDEDFTGPYDFEVSAGRNGVGGVGNGEWPADSLLSGVVTASEWRDLSQWAFWSGLMLGQDYSDKCDYWQCYTDHRVPVRVTDSAGNGLAGVSVRLMREGKTLWESVTDNHGEADCWVSLWQKSASADASALRVSLDGLPMESAPVVCPLDSMAQPTVNHYVLDRPENGPKRQADIAFIVDATGSMLDEIFFLKSDLLDILGRVSAQHADQEFRTAALFYRDVEDEYLTRHSDFTADATTTEAFVKQQTALGGGDYPEAVHTALEHMLQNLSWDTSARTRLAFMLLDAPAHHEDDVIRSLQQSLTTCARMGIRLIPIAASGADKNTEFMLRFFAIATGGTYVFLTDDSGVGLPHIKASVGDCKVELLNELIVRLINEYTE